MANKMPSVILGSSIIFAAIIYAAPSIFAELSEQNVIATTNGGVRLGKIYQEALKVSVEMKNSETGEAFISVDENADKIYESAKAEFQKIIDLSNSGVKSEKEKIALESATLKLPMVLTIRTYIAYKSEYHQNYVLTLSEIESAAGAGTNINRALVQSQEHSSRMLKEFYEKHQRLKAVGI